MKRIVIPIQNGQTLTVDVDDKGNATLRIAKDGHNRGIAKVSAKDAKRIAAHLTTK